MKHKLSLLFIAGILVFALPAGLRAADPQASPSPGGDGQCNGQCHHHHHKHHHNDQSVASPSPSVKP